MTHHGVCLGLIQWLGIQVFGNIAYENKPGTESHWPTPIYLFNEPVTVVPGQILDIKATLLEDSVWFQLLN